MELLDLTCCLVDEYDDYEIFYEMGNGGGLRTCF